MAVALRYIGGIGMKKFEGWRTEELQFIATMVAGRDMLELDVEQHLYQELIREIRNRRIAQELFQMKLEGIEEE
jgi:hypothetical protein